MAVDVPEQRMGNLDAEQEKKLRHVWETVFKLNKMFESLKEKDGSTDQKLTMKDLKQLKSAPEVQSLGLSDALWNTLSAQTPESIRSMIMGSVKHEHPDALLLRFLRARKWDTNAALVMMFSAMNWRYSEAKIDDDIMRNGEGGALRDQNREELPKAERTLAADYLKQARVGKSFLHGTDRMNRPICVVRARLHRASDQVPQSIERYTAYLIETGRFLVDAPVETCCLIFDLTGFGLANMDYTPVKYIIKCFEANYPESLGVILIHNAPFVFKGIWRIIRGWLDPVVRDKVNFTYGRAGLEPFIAPDHIIKELGGDEDWEYSYQEPVAGENDRMNDTETRDRLIQEREKIAAEFEVASQGWVDAAAKGEDATPFKQERDRLAGKLSEAYWAMDPYIRARSLYDRLGNIQGSGKSNWYGGAANGTNGSEETKAANGNAA